MLACFVIFLYEIFRFANIITNTATIYILFIRKSTKFDWQKLELTVTSQVTVNFGL
jgi:hypothetical protein